MHQRQLRQERLDALPHALLQSELTNKQAAEPGEETADSPHGDLHGSTSGHSVAAVCFGLWVEES